MLALDPSSIGSGFGGVGQLLTLASALAYAGHIVATGRFANPSNVASLGLYQTITVAVVCTIAALPGGLSAPTHMEDWLALAYLAVICGTLTTFMQSWGQARVESTRAAVIMCTEPLWGAIFAIGLGGETLTGRITIGGIAILAAMVVVAVHLSTTPSLRRPRSIRPGLRGSAWTECSKSFKSQSSGTSQGWPPRRSWKMVGTISW